MIDAKPIPNSNKVVSIFSPGHGRVEHAGIICLIDLRGPNNRWARRFSRSNSAMI
jgi:hypothetical protein